VTTTSLKAFQGEYQEVMEKRISSYRRIAVLALIGGLLVGMLAGASYWSLYGYPASTVTMEVMESQEVEPVKVHSA
jgi:CHASE3 domain sensor protein